jgi:hypothetical protein
LEKGGAKKHISQPEANGTGIVELARSFDSTILFLKNSHFLERDAGIGIKLHFSFGAAPE